MLELLMYKNIRIRNLQSCVSQTLKQSLWVNLHLSFTINEWENSRIRLSAHISYYVQLVVSCNCSLLSAWHCQGLKSCIKCPLVLTHWRLFNVVNCLLCPLVTVSYCHVLSRLFKVAATSLKLESRLVTILTRLARTHDLGTEVIFCTPLIGSCVRNKASTLHVVSF